jgi:hypothetical protein
MEHAVSFTLKIAYTFQITEIQIEITKEVVVAVTSDVTRVLN